MRKLLWVGDAACPSGFALSTHKILEQLDYRLKGDWEATVLGLNYRGDPHPEQPYDIYAAAAEGDSFGIERIVWMCGLVQPDVIVIQNDPWNIPLYLERLRAKNAKGEFRYPEAASTPVVAILAVDGKNMSGAELNGLSLAIFWTQFALDEARLGGYTGPAVVIPLGVDLKVYKPEDKKEARKACGLEQYAESFIVGNVNRNQPRKRWDLTIRYFAEWIKSKKVEDAYLFLHVAPTGDTGCNIRQLMKYYGVVDRLMLSEPQVFYGLPEQAMVDIYNSFDVAVSTTQGEGFGLTAIEAMACGVPCILPDWSALGDWAKGAAWFVPCTSTAVGPPYLNVVGGVADEAKFIAALDALYRHPNYRETNRAAGLERVNEPRFRWEHIGAAVHEVLLHALYASPGAVSKDVLEGQPA